MQGRVSKSKNSGIFFFQLYRDMIDIQHHISKFKDKNLLIDLFLYRKMITITIIALANTCIMSHTYHFL